MLSHILSEKIYWIMMINLEMRVISNTDMGGERVNSNFEMKQTKNILQALASLITMKLPNRKAKWQKNNEYMTYHRFFLLRSSDIKSEKMKWVIPAYLFFLSVVAYAYWLCHFILLPIKWYYNFSCERNRKRHIEAVSIHRSLFF